MDQAEEIVSRNKGDIDDLVCHINKELHITAIMHKRLDDGIYKSFLQVKAEQLQLIKTELQIVLDNYNRCKK